MKKFRNEYEENGKAIRRKENDFTKKVGAISPTAEGPGRIWCISEENKEIADLLPKFNANENAALKK